MCRTQDAAASVALALRLDERFSVLLGCSALLVVCCVHRLAAMPPGDDNARLVAVSLLAAVGSCALCILLVRHNAPAPRPNGGGDPGASASGGAAAASRHAAEGGGDLALPPAAVAWGRWRRAGMVALLLLWGVLAPILTQASPAELAAAADGGPPPASPFAVPGNAYFALWLGLSCAFSIALQEFGPPPIRAEPRPPPPPAHEAPRTCPLCGGVAAAGDRMVSLCSVCGGSCHDKCVTKAGDETAYKEQPDWVCPACKKFYAEAVAEQAQDLQQPRPVEADGTRTSQPASGSVAGTSVQACRTPGSP